MNKISINSHEQTVMLVINVTHLYVMLNMYNLSFSIQISTLMLAY